MSEIVKWSQFELLIDTQIFSKDIVLKTSYNFLDEWYFFFKLDDQRNLIVQCSLKDGIKKDPKVILWEFSDELLDMYLRDRLEKDNRIIRETIVSKSLLGPLDTMNYVSHDPDNQKEIDFDKDIDEIIKEIENDPDLQIDEQEIQQMLKEIEEETSPWTSETQKPTITVDADSISQAKDMFKKKK